jgi:hypothetical protein
MYGSAVSPTDQRQLYMSNPDQINLGKREAPLTEVMNEGIAFQILQGLARLESRLERLENRLSSRSDGVRRVADKPNIRNLLIAQLQKGWMSEVEAIEKTGWQTIGVRSFVTKLKTLGLSVESEERDGVPYYRIAK